MTLDQDSTFEATLADHADERDPAAKSGVSDFVERLGRYRIIERLGEGGMGVVLSAHDEQLDRQVALKLLTRRRHDPIAHERLVREARSLARLSHPNIVSVYEVSESEGTPYLVMELVVGQTLRQWLEGDGTRVPSRLEILRMFLAIGRGLEAAHDLGVVHRDFKPDNVLVGHDGRARVVDFGLARIAHLENESDASDREAVANVQAGEREPSLTATGALMGTPGLHGARAVDGAAGRCTQRSILVLRGAVSGDLWSPAICGRQHGLADGRCARERTDARIRRRALAGALHEVIVRGLEKQPDRRWASMGPLLESIEAMLVSAQPGVFDGRPPYLVLAMLPMFILFPVLTIILELTGVLAYAPVNWAIASTAQIVLLITLVTVMRRRASELVNDRRLLGMPFLIAIFLLGHRFIAFSTGTSLEVMFAYDFLAVVGIGSIMTFLADRRLWPVIRVQSDLGGGIERPADLGAAAVVGVQLRAADGRGGELESLA